MADAAGTPRLLRAFGANDPLTDSERVTRQGDELRVVYEKRGFLARMFDQGYSVVYLFKADVPDSDISTLIFRAKVRTEGTTKDAKFSIAIGESPSFPKGIGVATPGEWTSLEISAPIKGEKISEPVQLVLVSGGVGSVFLKDVELFAEDMRL